MPVTLKRFLALEFVLTFGILKCFDVQPLRRSAPADTCGAFLEQCASFYRRGAKIGIEKEQRALNLNNFVKSKEKRSCGDSVCRYNNLIID